MARVLGKVVEGLGRELGVGDEVVGGFIEWLLGGYLTKHRSVGENRRYRVRRGTGRCEPSGIFIIYYIN